MIKFIEQANAYVLNTKNTTYCFRVTETLHLEHLYYGKSLGEAEDLGAEDIAAMTEKKEFEEGNMIAYDSEHKNCTLENMCLEMSSYGKGDIREPFVEIIHSDGSKTSDFLFEGAKTEDTKREYRTLPGSYFEGEGCEKLSVTLADKTAGLKLKLCYYVYELCDVICRSAELMNEGEAAVVIERLLSSQIDFEDSGYIVKNFTGAWAREMMPSDTPVKCGKFVNASMTGTSSNRANPFIMLHEENTSESSGKCYGFNLIYSGNHYECVEVNSYGKTRVVMGINPRNFSFTLLTGERFEAPEAVMTFSDEGYTGVSKNMHHFIRKHILPPQWRDKERPVLLNSWEASYFNISESKLLKLAKSAKEAGVEMVVLDDGWFGKRNDDAHSLGDWRVNKEKFPNGISGVAKKIREMGLEFGIWIEPEMVNVESDFFKKHEDCVIQIPGKSHSEGRNQRILDLCNPKVCRYLIKWISRMIESADISYVKWDMNRIFSDVYSPYLAAKYRSEGVTVDKQEDRDNVGQHVFVQGEVMHRYVVGLYSVMKELVRRFPDVLFEGCASGGNRFDLGMLCYFPQIWASDNTDAIVRSHIQEGISYGYPLSVAAAHLSSCPNHQTLRNTDLQTRFAVAMFGIFGLECNLADMNKESLEELKSLVALYHEWRDVLQNGDFYRGRTGNLHEWTCVSKDRKRAVGMILQELAVPNMQFEKYTARGLEPDYRYHLYNIREKHDIRKFGDLINTEAPVHIKQNSMVHNVIARFVTMPGEAEDITVSGRVLMNAGIKLKPAYSGMGYNENTRYFQDFCARIYFMEAVT